MRVRLVCVRNDSLRRQMLGLGVLDFSPLIHVEEGTADDADPARKALEQTCDNASIRQRETLRDRRRKAMACSVVNYLDLFFRRHTLKLISDLRRKHRRHSLSPMKYAFRTYSILICSLINGTTSRPVAEHSEAVRLATLR